MNNLSDIKAIVERWLAGTDIFLVEIKLSPGKLLVLVDSPAGIRLDECASLNRFLFDQLDPSGFNDSHTIEVSSPGIDVPFKVKQQYQKHIGKNVIVKTQDGERIQGKLTEAGEELITVETRQTKKQPARSVQLAYSQIAETKAQITFHHETNFQS